MTDTYDSHPLLDDGGQWLPQPATAHATIEGSADTPNDAIDALYITLVEAWPGWRLASDIKVVRREFDLRFGPPYCGYVATADITKQVTP